MFGMGTGITSPLWPPGIINNACRPLFFSFSPSGFPLPARREVRPPRDVPTSDCRDTISFGRYARRTFSKVLYKNDNMVKPHDLLVLVG